jgi:hypothetical protein
LCELTDSFDQTVQGTLGQEALKNKLAQFKQQADLIKESLGGLKRVRNIVQSLKDFAHIGETDWQLADLHAGIGSTLTIASDGGIAVRTRNQPSTRMGAGWKSETTARISHPTF